MFNSGRLFSYQSRRGRLAVRCAFSWEKADLSAKCLRHKEKRKELKL